MRRAHRGDLLAEESPTTHNRAVGYSYETATQALNLSAGVSNPKVFRGRSFS
jgi:hypothetical protein